MAKKIKTSGFTKKELVTFDDMESEQEDFEKIPRVEARLERDMGDRRMREKVAMGEVTPNDLMSDMAITSNKVKGAAYPQLAKTLNDKRKYRLEVIQKAYGDKAMEDELHHMGKDAGEKRYKEAVRKLSKKGK
jgi:hypothetical protein